VVTILFGEDVVGVNEGARVNDVLSVGVACE